MTEHRTLKASLMHVQVQDGYIACGTHWFVSTYVECERLSVMQRQARLPEIFDQNPHFTPEVEFGSTSPPSQKFKLFPLSSDLTYFTSLPPPLWNSNSNFFLWVQIWPISHHPPPPRNSNSNLFLWVQIWSISHHPPPPRIREIVCGD